MKKLLSVSLLILCLSFPVFGGHTTQGNGWCECDNPNQPHGPFGLAIENEAEFKQDFTPNDEVSELDLLIDVLLIIIRL